MRVAHGHRSSTSEWDLEKLLGHNQLGVLLKALEIHEGLGIMVCKRVLKTRRLEKLCYTGMKLTNTILWPGDGSPIGFAVVGMLRSTFVAFFGFKSEAKGSTHLGSGFGALLLPLPLAGLAEEYDVSASAGELRTCDVLLFTAAACRKTQLGTCLTDG